MLKMTVILLMNILIDLCRCSLVSYNLPKFCPNASWSTPPVKFATSDTVGTLPVGIFVDINNTIYATSSGSSQVTMWFNGDKTRKSTIPGQWSAPMSVFATLRGDIYVDNGQNNQVVMWNSNTMESVEVMNVDGCCNGLFVDSNDALYCSMFQFHKVIKKLPNSDSNAPTSTIGTGIPGAESNMLNTPFGIFVYVNFTLYVADSENNRIQSFHPGQSNGITVADKGIVPSIILDRPTGVVLDGNGYLFIVDSVGHIFGSGPNGFRCLVECLVSGSSIYDSFPGLRRLSFDSYGNIFATDRSQDLVLKFSLATNSCGTTTPQEITTQETVTTPWETTTSTTDMGENSTNAIHPIASAIVRTLTKQATTSYQTTSIAKTTTIVNTEKSSLTTIYGSTTTATTMSPSPFFTPRCNDETRIGDNCNISNAPCDMFNPCQNKGSCENINTEPFGYKCQCSTEVPATICQFNRRQCESNPCWNNGTCVDFNGTFFCICEYGWEGSHCQKTENFCKNVTCKNRGVCRPLLRGYKCECLGIDYYSGGLCEIILVMISAAMFIIIMDILRYCFGIDPTSEERERIRRKKRARKRKPVIQRFTYVNAPLSQVPEEATVSMGETTV